MDLVPVTEEEREFAEQWAAETGEPFDLTDEIDVSVVRVLMDREADARYHRNMGGA